MDLNVALHNIRSLYNVGSVFRTSSGAGFDHIFLSGYTGAPPHPRLAKVALGAEQDVPFSRFETVASLLDQIEGHHVIVLEHSPLSYAFSELLPPKDRPTTLILGEELFGAPSELITRADVVAEIPMAGKKSSLNVASAFAVVAYELGMKLGKVSTADLKSRQIPAAPRPGVLTDGPTVGEIPS